MITVMAAGIVAAAIPSAEALARETAPKAEVRTYRGSIEYPSGAMRIVTLSISAAPHSGDGTFSLSVTELGSDGRIGERSYNGRRYTQRGTPDDINATVWQMMTDSGDHFNFLRLDEQTLILLDNDFSRREQASELILSWLDLTSRYPS